MVGINTMIVVVPPGGARAHGLHRRRSLQPASQSAAAGEIIILYNVT